jgi:hypothetical protein
LPPRIVTSLSEFRFSDLPMPDRLAVHAAVVRRIAGALLARSNAKERSDISNSVCACPRHDTAFDAGLLTVTPDLTIVRARPTDSQLAENASEARPCALSCSCHQRPLGRDSCSSSTTAICSRALIKRTGSCRNRSTETQRVPASSFMA